MAGICEKLTERIRSNVVPTVPGHCVARCRRRGANVANLHEPFRSIVRIWKKYTPILVIEKLLPTLWGNHLFLPDYILSSDDVKYGVG
jgi:hypothetical protein